MKKYENNCSILSLSVNILPLANSLPIQITDIQPTINRSFFKIGK